MEQARENKTFCGNACRGKYHRMQVAEEEREQEIRQRLLESMQQLAPPMIEVQEQTAYDEAEVARLEAIMLAIAKEEQTIEGHMKAIAEIEAKVETELMDLPDAITKAQAEIVRLEGLQRLKPVDFYNFVLNEELKELNVLARSGNVSADFFDLSYPYRLKQVLVTTIPLGSPLWAKVEDGFARLRRAVLEKKQERDGLAGRLDIARKSKEKPSFLVETRKMQIVLAKRRIEALERKRLEQPTPPPPTIVALGMHTDGGPMPSDVRTETRPDQTALGRVTPMQQHIAYAEPKKPKPPKGEIGGADLLSEESETFMLEGALGAFIGRMDRKMAAIGLTGDSGSGKSTFSLTLAGLFARHGFTVKYFSLEEGLGDSMKKKIRAARIGNDVKFAEGASLYAIRQDAKRFDVIFIDSFTILDAGQDELEKLRKDFPETIFVCIHQKTTGGTIRGGTKIFYNSTAIINIEIDHDRGRLAVMKKSRYGTEGFMYNINEDEVFRVGEW